MSMTKTIATNLPLLKTTDTQLTNHYREKTMTNATATKTFYAKVEFIQNDITFFADNNLNLADPSAPTDEETIQHLADALDACYDDADEGNTLDLNGMTPEQFATELVRNEEGMKAQGTEWSIYTKFQEVSAETTEWSV